MNLVLNARDALRDKGRIVISTSNREIKARSPSQRRHPARATMCASRVKDNGTGMDAETQQHLFEPFFTTKPEGKGTGLGLALVYGVVQQSGGYIKCAAQSSSAPPSKFCCRKRATGEVRRASRNPRRSPRHAAMYPAVDRRRRRRAQNGRRDLTADGYRVYAAKTAGEALSLALNATHPVQLLIASGDRAKLAQTLRAKQPELRLLDIGQEETKHPFERHQPDYVARLPKPFALGELLKAARKLLDT